MVGGTGGGAIDEFRCSDASAEAGEAVIAPIPGNATPLKDCLCAVCCGCFWLVAETGGGASGVV